jgi:hypothetical protein
MFSRVEKWIGITCSWMFFTLCGVALWNGDYDPLWFLLKIFFGSLVAVALLDAASGAIKRVLKRRATTSPNQPENSDA